MPKIVDHAAQRERIADAALDQIGRHGLERVRLADIARAVDATTGTVTHYFDGKDALLAAALDRLAERIYADAQNAEELLLGKDPFLALAKALPIDAQGRRDWRVWLCYWGRAISDGELAARHNTYYSRIQNVLSESLASLQASGDVNSALPADDLADAVLAAVDGIGVRASLAPRAWPAARQRALLETMLTPLLSPTD